MIRTYACPDDCGLNCRIQFDGNDLEGVAAPCLLMDRGEMYGWLPVEANGGDPILAWLEREAAEARRVLMAERDHGNVEIMRQWVYLHECLVRLRLDEMGLLDVDDEPAGGERR
jgi:hypothetical protein